MKLQSLLFRLASISMLLLCTLFGVHSFQQPPSMRFVPRRFTNGCTPQRFSRSMAPLHLSSSSPPPSDDSNSNSEDSNSDREERWEVMFQLLVEYNKREGGPPLPGKLRNGDELGKWLKEQRQLDRADERWMKMFQLLVEYEKRTDKGGPPLPGKRRNGNELGKWLEKQRQLYRAGKLPRMPKDGPEDGEYGVEWKLP